MKIKYGIGCLAAMLLVIAIIAGCSRPVERAGDNLAQELIDQGVNIISTAVMERDGQKILAITGFGMDQTAINKIREASGDDLLLEIQEAEEVFFIEGIIGKIETGNDGQVILWVEEGSGQSQAESAYVSVVGYTRILFKKDSINLAYQANALKEGQRIRVLNAGVVLTSLPPQISASTIIILDD